MFDQFVKTCKGDEWDIPKKTEVSPVHYFTIIRLLAVLSEKEREQTIEQLVVL